MNKPHLPLILTLLALTTLATTLDPAPAHAGTIVQAPMYVGLDNGLIGYWSFEQKDTVGTTAYDRSANANHGTLVSTPKRGIGRIGQGLEFSGATNEGVNVIGAADEINYATGTISAWVKLTATAAGDQLDYSIAGFGADAGNNGDIRLMKRAAGTSDTVRLQYHPSGGSTFAAEDFRLKDYANEWKHVVGVWDSWNVYLYVDGVLYDTSPRTQTAVNLDKADIGRATIGINATDEFSGSIDEVRMYNRALTPTEIKRLHNMGATTKFGISPGNVTRGLVGHWTFDGKDVAGDTIYDRSVNANNLIKQSSKPQNTLGRLGQGLDFDGVDSWLETANDVDEFDFTGSFSISAWVYARSYGESSAGRIADKRQLDTDGWRFILTSQHKISIQMAGSSISSSSDFELNRWQHVMVVYDSVVATIYVDNVVVGSGAIGAPISNSELLSIGGQENSGAVFDGIIDDLRLYNRALTLNERTRLYKSGATTKVNTTRTNVLTDGLIGYWTFDGKDVSGSIAFDRSCPLPWWPLCHDGISVDGTIVDGATPDIGRIGQGLNFDGVAGRVAIDGIVYGAPQDGYFNYASGTIAMWVKFDSSIIENSNNNAILIIGDGLGNNGFIGLYRDGIIGSNNDRLEFSYKRTGVAATTVGVTDLDEFADSWRHIAGLWDHDKIYLYIDGVLRDSTDRGSDASSFDEADIGDGVGCSGGGCLGGDFYKGTMDDVRIYNRALSPESSSASTSWAAVSP